VTDQDIRDIARASAVSGKVVVCGSTQQCTAMTGERPFSDFAPPRPLVSVTATLAAFRVLDKWNERDKREKEGATINFFEYLEVVHGAQVPRRGGRAPVVSRTLSSGGGILRCPSQDRGSGMLHKPRPVRMVKSPSLGDLRAYEQDKHQGQQQEQELADEQPAGDDDDHGGHHERNRHDHGGVTARSRRITFCIGAEEKDWSNFARSHFPKEFSRSQSPQHSSPLQSPGRASPRSPGSPVHAQQLRSAWHDVTPEAPQQSHAGKAQGKSGGAAARGHELAHRDADPYLVGEDGEGGDSPIPHQRRLHSPRRGIIPFNNTADYLCDSEPRGAGGSSSEPSLAVLAISHDAMPAAGGAQAAPASSSPQGSACAGGSEGAPTGAAEASFSPACVTAWHKQDATQELVPLHVPHHRRVAHSTPPPAPPADAEDPPDMEVISLEAAPQPPSAKGFSDPEVVAGKLEVQV
jgi:hypothetical protein